MSMLKALCASSEASEAHEAELDVVTRLSQPRDQECHVQNTQVDA
jgi:hypothetical protein